MTDNRNDDERRSGNPVIGWLMFPLALMPLVALLTYDWHAIARLHSPAQETTNWLGALGDTFAYYGYNLFGIAIWVVPAVCFVYGVRMVFGSRVMPTRRSLWFILLLISTSCLVQVGQRYAPGIDALREQTNIGNAGGVVGYLLADLVLTPLLSDIGTSALLAILIVVSAIASVGLRNLATFFSSAYRWAMARGENGAEEFASDEEREAALEAARMAKEAAKAQARAEKEAARQAKEAAKAQARAEKEAARQAKEEAKAQAEAERLAAIERLRGNSTAQEEPARVKTAPAPAKTPTAKTVTPPVDTTSEPEEDKGPYVLPPVDLLSPIKKSVADHSDVGEMSQKLLDTLKLFNIDATLAYTVQGPVVTKYAIMLAPGTKYQVVSSIADNLKGALRAKSLRIETPIPGEEAIGIEVPNRRPAGISFREIFESSTWRNFKAELPLLFGKDAAGKELVADLATMPHMLVAGATGQGKSVCLNSLICGLLMSRTPEQLKLIMVDPKSVEFTPYSSIPHLLVPVITDNRKVVASLGWAVNEMEKRLKMFARAKVKNIYDFNHRRQGVSQPDMFSNGDDTSDDTPKTVPYIVIIIDEAADLIGQCGKDVNPNIQRITQKARAAGIHIILATQRPDAKIITGAIKANIPGRVAFKTASSVDSRTILDDTGAENLIGRGDMLFKGKDGNLIRAQGSWIADDEIARVTGFIEQHSNVQFDNDFTTKLGRIKEAAAEDPFAKFTEDSDSGEGQSGPTARETVKANADADLFKRALECIINTNRASVSHFQRRLGIGYNHAAKLCDKLEDAGVIAAQSGAGPRTILMTQPELMGLFNGGGESAAPEDETGGDETFNDNIESDNIQEGDALSENEEQ